MNQRQTPPKPRNTRQTQDNTNKLRASLPPVLFSLPDLSEPSEQQTVASVSTFPACLVSTYSDSVAASVPPARDLPKAQAQHPQADGQARGKSTSLLNTAIGFLAFVLLLIGLKLYTDRVSEQSRIQQRLISNAPANSEPATAATSTPIGLAPASKRNNPSELPNTETMPNENPAPRSAGPRRATFELPVAPNNLSSANVAEDSDSDKAVLEIFDPVVTASHNTSHHIEPIESTSASTSSVSSVMPTLMPQAPAEPTPPAIQASSLNTRDMILLRQGKSIDLVNRDRETNPIAMPVKNNGNVGVKLTGETYPPVRQNPPVRQKYEPVGLPLNGTPVSRPTSIEVPEPPKPYQPIGTSMNQ